MSRQKRDIPNVDIAQYVEEDEDDENQMRLSHEIIVLDYGDEQNNPYDPDIEDYLKSESTKNGTYI